MKTIGFLELVSDKDTRNLSKRNITVSTCGIADKIVLLADSGAGVNLSVSLHSPFQEQRENHASSQKIFVERVNGSLSLLCRKTKRRITLEYALISGVNDTPEHALALAQLTKTLHCLVNLIPMNETSRPLLKAVEKKRCGFCGNFDKEADYRHNQKNVGQ